MSSSSSPEASAIIAAYEYTRTLGNVETAVVALLVYDAVECMDKEVQYVWRAPRTSGRNSRILYLYIRYLSIIFNVYDIVLSSKLSTMSCTVLGWIGNILPILALLGPAAFTTLRVYALSARNKFITGVTLLLSFTPFIINVATLYLDTPTVMPPPVNCANVIPISQKTYTGLAVSSRVCLILADTLAAGVTWRRTRIASRVSTGARRPSSLEQIMWENGNIYFVTLATLSIVDMICVALSVATQPEGASYILIFIDPIGSILNSRFLLALYETNDVLEQGAGTSAVAASSLNFGGAGPGRTVSADLPEFLHSLGGPICSFSDEDTEPFDSESDPTGTSQPGTESESGTGEVDGGGVTLMGAASSSGDIVEVGKRE